jgi:hypothetical protein
MGRSKVNRVEERGENETATTLAWGIDLAEVVEVEADGMSWTL